MSTFQSIVISKYINNWNMSPTYHPTDPPQTITGLGSITTQTLSLLDTDIVQCVHGYPPYLTNYFAQKNLSIEFLTPNDGISHNYLVHQQMQVTGPTPPNPWPTPTSGADASYTGPWFEVTVDVQKWNVGLGSWVSVAGPGGATTYAYLEEGESYGLLKYTNHFGNTPYPDPNYPNHILTLLPNTLYKIIAVATQGILINTGLRLGDYFNYSANLSIYCPDFTGGGGMPVAGTNIVEMIIEQN
jgi:hypothetical protein